MCRNVVATRFCGCADSVNSRCVAEYEIGRRSINLERIIPNHNGWRYIKNWSNYHDYTLTTCCSGIFSWHESCLLAGVILQGILRNPLADPGIIGITSGGALAAMIIMILMPTYVMLVPIGAFVGALVASFLVYGISWQGGLNPLRLILAGVAVAAFFGGFNTILSVFYPDRVQGTVSWMAGGFVGRSWDDVMMIWPYTAMGIIGSMISIRWLTLLSLGDDTGTYLGGTC